MKDANLIIASREHPERWLRLCKLVDEATSTPIDFRITEPQQKVLDHILSYRHSYVVKYRQAKISTLCAFIMLNKAQYNPGKKGLLIAESDKTAKVLIERQRYALQYEPEAVRIDPDMNSTEGMTWPSFSSIRSLTAGGQNQTPGIGNSPDLTHITEFAEFKDQDNFNQHFFPAVSKRKGSWLVLETTPGAHGSVAHKMWLNALGGLGRMRPLFLKWYDDPTNTVPLPQGFTLTNEEIALKNKYPTLTDEHLMFRRVALETEFVKSGDLGFRHKYPWDEYDGWSLVGGTPAMPVDAINAALLRSRPAPTGTLTIFEEPKPGRKYLVTVDGNSYGASGDMSAIKAWDRVTRKEVATWDEREDPGLLANRAIEIAQMYNDARLMVESNKPEVIAACRARGYRNLYWDDESHPGWRATEMTKGEAVAALVDGLRDGDIHVQSNQTLQQMALWDGDVSRRITIGGKRKHHFDQVTTCYMAAWHFRKFPLPPEPANAYAAGAKSEEKYEVRGISWKDLNTNMNRRQKGGSRKGALGYQRR